MLKKGAGCNFPPPLIVFKAETTKTEMDFKYIEQLLERYFAVETTTQEEHILREFFSQEEVPEQLRPWKKLFEAEKALAEAHLSDAFDQRILQMVGEEHVKARRITLARRLRPLFKAAAFVAFAIVLGTAVEQASTSRQSATVDAAMQAAFEGDDELDASETTPLDIRAANAVLSDSTDITY